MKKVAPIRIILTILALTFAAGLLYTLYHIGYIAPQHLSDIFGTPSSPAQQQAEANKVIRQIFIYVSIEFVIALLLVITLAVYVNSSKQSNIVYVERNSEFQRNDNNSEQQQVSTHDEHIAEQLLRQIKELLQQSNTTQSPDKQLLEQLLTRVCHATGAVAGACFICNNYTQTVQGIASFALNQPISSEPFAYGEGFVGQVAQSGKLLYLYPVPENYLPVKTGLGSAQPLSLLYLPIIREGNTVGVIELGMFKQLSENLLENLQKNIHLSSPLFGNANIRANNSSNI
jgi:hypothetical protein